MHANIHNQTGQMRHTFVPVRNLPRPVVHSFAAWRSCWPQLAQGGHFGLCRRALVPLAWCHLLWPMPSQAKPSMNLSDFLWPTKSCSTFKHLDSLGRLLVTWPQFWVPQGTRRTILPFWRQHRSVCDVLTGPQPCYTFSAHPGPQTGCLWSLCPTFHHTHEFSAP